MLLLRAVNHITFHLTMADSKASKPKKRLHIGIKTYTVVSFPAVIGVIMQCSSGRGALHDNPNNNCSQTTKHMESGMVFEGTTGVYEHICHFICK